MAQSIKTKIRTMTKVHNIDAIIQMAHEVKEEMLDEQDWDRMSNQEKLQWFYDQCAKYGLTTSQYAHQIAVDQLPCVGNHNGSKAYFCVFLPKDGDVFKLEIGSAYANHKVGSIWYTSPGRLGKEKQIAEVIRLHAEGK
jgi:hypothetical protein